PSSILLCPDAANRWWCGAASTLPPSGRGRQRRELLHDAEVVLQVPVLDNALAGDPKDIDARQGDGAAGGVQTGQRAGVGGGGAPGADHAVVLRDELIDGEAEIREG